MSPCCSVPADLPASVPADGGAGGPEHPGHYLWQTRQDPRLLPVLAQNKDLQVGRRKWPQGAVNWGRVKWGRAVSFGG